MHQESEPIYQYAKYIFDNFKSLMKQPSKELANLERIFGEETSLECYHFCFVYAENYLKTKKNFNSKDIEKLRPKGTPALLLLGASYVIGKTEIVEELANEITDALKSLKNDQ